MQDCDTYYSIDKILNILKTKTKKSHEIGDDLQNILDNNDTAKKILDLISDKYNISYESSQHIIPDCMALHLLLLTKCYNSLPFVANKLDIDFDIAKEILEHFKHTFTIDDPVLWLENFLKQSESDVLQCEISKKDLLLGRAIVNQAQDTAEERRVKDRNRHPKPEVN